MAKGRVKPELSEERIAEIRADARSGRNWAEEASLGPACICGAGQRSIDAAVALKSPMASPQGMCARHPGGSVWRSLRKET